MIERRGIYERVDTEVAEGRLWRAKEILQGNIRTLGYDTELFERYGQVLLAMGDVVEAGKYLFLSGEHKPDYHEPIALYLSRHTRKDPRNLLGTFPDVSRLPQLADYPDAVRQTLEGLGISDETLANAPHYTWERRESIWTKLGCGLGCVLCLAVLAFLGACVLAGLPAVLEWLLG